MYQIPLSFLYIFLFTATTKFAVSQPPDTNCILDFKTTRFFPDCGGGDWGGFLQNACCGVPFHMYLYALGRQANQTGQIYLNSTEQNNCLTSLKSIEKHVFGCGIEKLTSGGGGCSDFSADDVMKKLGRKLLALKESCEHVNLDGESNQTCHSCMRSWEEIGGRHSKNDQSLEAETYICRFAVLVALTSTRIQDEAWVQAVHQCLGEQHFNLDDREPVKKGNKKISIVVCIAIGGAIWIGVILVIAGWIMWRRWYGSNAVPKRDVSKNLLLETPGCMKLAIKEVYFATNNLNERNVIGKGTAGKVYKGILSNNQHVAIKHIINDCYVETAVREVTSLSHVRHPNLVALLGFCEEEDECFLVYELCINGNLSEWLYGKDKVLPWILRLEIAIDCARGLSFLHTYPEGAIVHRDIKPTNILLGVNFEAKLSDFGLSKVIDKGESFVSSEVRGTFGYVDPEYQINNHVNSSGDVYSFGIVLLQILSGKKVINMNLNKPMTLDRTAKLLMKGGSMTELIDPRLDGEYSAEAFDLTLKLALSCTTLKRQRPSMEQVVVTLENALHISEKAKASTPRATPSRPSTPERLNS